MCGEISIVGDGEGLAIIGNPSDVERFLLNSGLEHVPSKTLDAHRLSALMGAGGSAVQAAAVIAESSGRWVKLTADSVQAIAKYGLTPKKGGGVWAMTGAPGDIKKWLQLDDGSLVKAGSFLGGPTGLIALSAMMQQQAMQQQMKEIEEYLKNIAEKVDDILRGQKDAVFADLIGVDLIIEDAMTVREQTGRVSEVTWSKVQQTSMTIARTQAYAMRQLDAISEKLEQKIDVGDIARATKEAEPQIREWLAVLARTFRLQDGVSVLELDRVLDGSPDDLDKHRLGLQIARANRLDLIGQATFRLLEKMDKTVRIANDKVLFNPFDAPAAVASSNQVTDAVHGFRDMLGIDSRHDVTDAKRWLAAAQETRDKVLSAVADGIGSAQRVGTETLDRVAQPFQAVDIDGDGIPDKPQALTVVENAGSAIKGVASGVARFGGSLFKSRRQGTPPEGTSPQAADDSPGGPASS